MIGMQGFVEPGQSMGWQLSMVADQETLLAMVANEIDDLEAF